MLRKKLLQLNYITQFSAAGENFLGYNTKTSQKIAQRGGRKNEQKALRFEIERYEGGGRKFLIWALRNLWTLPYYNFNIQAPLPSSQELRLDSHELTNFLQNLEETNFVKQEYQSKIPRPSQKTCYHPQSKPAQSRDANQRFSIK